jgi:hypothetical protein
LSVEKAAKTAKYGASAGNADGNARFLFAGLDHGLPGHFLHLPGNALAPALSQPANTAQNAHKSANSTIFFAAARRLLSLPASKCSCFVLSLEWRNL